MNYGSKYVEEAINQFASLPGIGKKTALRLVLHIIQKDAAYAEGFGQAISQMRAKIKHCSICCNISDEDICQICALPGRDQTKVCVVESIRDVMAIEQTSQYHGLYHVLGGVISPIEGIAPSDLYITELEKRVKKGRIEELIMAISPTIDGETTAFYLYKLFAHSNVKVSQLSRGIAFGGELEYADEVTLGRSIMSRMPYSTGAQ